MNIILILKYALGVILATGGIFATFRLVKLFLREYRFIKAAQEWEDWSHRYLINKFWGMFAGKEPLCPGLVGQFITDLRFVVISLNKTKKPILNASSEWLEKYRGKLTGDLFAISFKHHYNDNRYPREYEDISSLLNSYLPYDLIGNMHPYNDYQETIYSNIQISSEHFAGETALINPTFIKELIKFSVKGLPAVTQELPEQPVMEWKTIPKKYWGPCLQEAEQFLKDPLEAEIAEAVVAIEELRTYASHDEAIAKLVAHMEEALEIVRNKQGNIESALSTSAIQQQAKDAKEAIAKNTAIDIASEKVSKLLKDAEALEKAVKDVYSKDTGVTEELLDISAKSL